MRRYTAEQRAWGGSQEHGHATERDGAATEGNNHEPEGNHQGTDLQADKVRKSERVRARRREGRRPTEGNGHKEHNGRCVEGSDGHTGSTLTDFTVTQAEAGEPGGMFVLLERFLPCQARWIYLRLNGVAIVATLIFILHQFTVF